MVKSKEPNEKKSTLFDEYRWMLELPKQKYIVSSGKCVNRPTISSTNHKKTNSLQLSN